MPAQVALLDYAGAQQAAVLGLRDLLETAVRLHGGDPPPLQVAVLEARPRPWRPAQPLSLVVLPPSLEPTPPSDPTGALVRWLRAQHARGTTLGSVCAGAFLLAETGLLDGRTVTTHWALGDAFSARFPRVRLDLDRIVVDDGDLLTAGGVMAWVDLGLRVVDRYLGPASVLATARQLLVDPGGREQRFYSAFAPVLTHGDGAILAAQRWLQRRSAERVDVGRMAAVARLGERTFLRRFVRATGLRPTEYLQHLRVGRARELLERSDCSVDEVAASVGYEDTGAFRKTFTRILGLSPSEYRRRFTVRSRGGSR
ncbi:MAG: helix-turn-helix domain-containing protein [Polyangiaceae bacterium]|nr:helix-turn-helix domain-containing protein [Polyangiaceae bacterium]